MWKLFPIVLVLSIILFFEIKGKQERKTFFNSSLNNKITAIKNNWTGGRSYDYVVDNIIITLSNSDTLVIGDSIFKKANTNKFEVYRKRNGNYEFHKHLDVSK